MPDFTDYPAGEPRKQAFFDFLLPYDSVTASVETSMRNLNRNRAYRTLRGIRDDLREQDQSITGLRLADGLTNYSERGEACIDELQSMISFNDLGTLDR